MVTSSRRGSSFIGYGSTKRHNSVIGNGYDRDDTTNIPNSVIERRASVRDHDYSRWKKPTFQDMPNLVGYNVKESVYLLPPKSGFSARNWLVAPCCFLYMMGYFSFQSIISQYIYDRVKTQMYPDIDRFNETSSCYTNKSDPNYEMQTKVQQKASEWSMWFSLVAGIPALFTSIIFGASADKYGRKLIFFLPLTGALVKLMGTALMMYFKVDLKYFLIVNAVDGLTGYVATILLLSFSYIADITPPYGRQRSLAITLLELVNGIGVTLGNFGTGYFIEATQYFYPTLTCGVLIFVAIIFAVFLPESFPKEERNLEESLCDKIKTVVGLFFGSANAGRRWMYYFLIVIFALTVFTSFSCSSVETFYLLDEPFCWTSVKLGYYMSAKSLLQYLIGIGLIKLLQKVMSDESIAMFGCVTYAANYVIEGLANNDAMMYIGEL